MTADPRPGWYPDPAGAPDHPVTRFRWWDGSDWGDATSDSAQAPTPASRPSRLRSAVVLAVGFTVFVGAALGGAVLLWRDPLSSSQVRSPLPGPASSGSAAAGGTGQLDFHSRQATIGQASMRLPDDPYELDKDPRQFRGLFDVAFLANAPVHENYVHGQDWLSSVMLVQLSGPLGGVDLDATGRAALHGLSRTIFYNDPTTVTELRTSDHSVDGGSGVLVTGRVGYQVAGLPSRFDTVTVLLVQLDDGTLVAGVTSVPNDAGPALEALAAQSLASLTVR